LTKLKIARKIKTTVERELWARTAGRCEFNGCNKLLYKSSITQERVNISEKAHIYSFSEKGPRGWGIFKQNLLGLNQIENLLLVCHECHKTIDKENDGGRYTAKLLIKWKNEHEKRVVVVTGVDPSKKSFVVLYGANIGDENALLQPEHSKYALFPDWYPAEERCTTLAMRWEGRDNDQGYWETEEQNLRESFSRQIFPMISDGCHFSIFGFAPIPLLIFLGTLFTDKVPARVYQLQREPEQTWQWEDSNESVSYIVTKPTAIQGPPVLVISLSSSISKERITSVVGSEVSIWELTIEKPNNDFLKTLKQLSEFRKVCRMLMVSICREHGTTTPLMVFPAMPVACSIEFGRIRMPKSEMPWIIFDQNKVKNAFVESLKIGAM